MNGWNQSQFKGLLFAIRKDGSERQNESTKNEQNECAKNALPLVIVGDLKFWRFRFGALVSALGNNPRGVEKVVIKTPLSGQVFELSGKKFNLDGS